MHNDGKNIYIQSVCMSYLTMDDFLTFGSSIRRAPKHPRPATLGLGHPQLVYVER